MDKAQAVESAWNNATGRAGFGAGSIAALVSAVGGTKAAAGLLGVTQRSVQRYVKSEKGTGGETRKASATQRTILGDAARKAQVQEARKAGSVKVSARGDVSVYAKDGPDGVAHGTEYTGHRDFAEELDPADLDDFWDAVEDGNWDAAADALEGPLFEEYGIPDSAFGDLDDLSFDF